MTGRPYHHGDLRAALVKAGLALMATRTADELSLREVARSVGVSANAIYRHFADKRALMAALAAEGLQQLADAQRAAASAAGGGVAGFRATGRAYVRFALANPALFRLVFSSANGSGNAQRGPRAETSDAMAFLQANAAREAGGAGDAATLALQAWSLAHGLAMLMLDGQVPPADETIERVFTGWAPPRPGAGGG